MAQESRRHKSAELKAEIAQSRDRLARQFRSVRSDLDIRRKIRRSFRENTAVWVGAAVAVGAVVVLFPRRKKVYVEAKDGGKPGRKPKMLEAGLLLGALRVAVTLFKPAITDFIVRRVRERGGTRRSPFKW